MNGIIHVIALWFLYGAIWFVPIGISIDRRKKKLPTYWFVFFTALIIEISLVYILLVGLSYISDHVAYAYIPPVLASIVAGLFYFNFTKKLDTRPS
jgi:hypothetical protein